MKTPTIRLPADNFTFDVDVEETIERVNNNTFDNSQQGFEKRLAKYDEYFESLKQKGRFFRGKPIEWAAETKVTRNMFGDDLIETGANCNRIRYEGIEYQPEEFFKAYFPEYKKYPYRVKFSDRAAKDLLRISVNQRNKLQYEILANKFGLVNVDSKDAEEIMDFFRLAEGQTGKRIYYKMSSCGIRPIITFGCGLKVDYNRSYPDAWAYSIDRSVENQTTFRGAYLSWGHLQEAVKGYLSMYCGWLMRYDLIKDRKEFYQRHINDPKYISWCKSKFYYQDGKYVTIPIEQKNALDLWFDRCVQDFSTPFALNGSIGYSDIRDLERDYFTIDYDKDVEIVPNIDLKKEMAAYNTEHNTERNKEHGKARIEKRAREAITADSFTRDDLAEWGYSPNAVSRLLRAGLIVKTSRRTSDRKCIYEKNFV